MSGEHHVPTEDEPQSRAEVRAMGDEARFEFMSQCPAEPADFINCLACYAYGVEQGLSDEAMDRVDAERRHLNEVQSVPSPYRLVLAERNRHSASITELPADDPRREYRYAFLDGLDRALDVIVREYGVD